MSDANNGASEFSDLEAFANQDESVPPTDPLVEEQEIFPGDVDPEAEEFEEAEAAEAPEDEAVASAEDEEEKEEEAPAKPAKKKDASSRVQQAVNKMREAEQRAAQIQQEAERKFQLLERQMAQREAQLTKAFEQQAEAQRAQLEFLQKKAEEEAFSKLPREQQLEREWMKKVESHVAPKYESKIGELERQLQQFQQAQEQARQEQQRRAQREYFWNQSLESVNKRFLADLPDADLDREEVAEFNLTYATAFGVPPEQAATKLKEFAEKYHKAKLKAVATKGQQKTVAPGKPGQKPVVQGKSQGKQVVTSDWPTGEVVRANGFKDHVDWLKKGKPVLTK